MRKMQVKTTYTSSRPTSRRFATAVAAVILTAVAAGSPFQGHFPAKAALPTERNLVAKSDSPLVRVTPSDCTTFEMTLASLAKQADVLFVAEGVPAHERGIAVLVPNAGKTSLDDVIKALAARGSSVPLMEATDKIAEAFDYEASWARGGAAGRIVLLRKRYSVPGDLPCLTIGETMAAIRDIQKIIANFDPRPAYERGKFRTAERDVIASLTDAQLVKMGLPDGLPVSSMPAAQQITCLQDGTSGIFGNAAPRLHIHPIRIGKNQRKPPVLRCGF